MFSSKTAAFRCKPRSFARLFGEFLNAALNSSGAIATISRASVRESFPAITSRAVKALACALIPNC